MKSIAYEWRRQTPGVAAALGTPVSLAWALQFSVDGGVYSLERIRHLLFVILPRQANYGANCLGFDTDV